MTLTNALEILKTRSTNATLGQVVAGDCGHLAIGVNKPRNNLLPNQIQTSSSFALRPGTVVLRKSVSHDSD